MFDFTISSYYKFLKSLSGVGYTFQTFTDFSQKFVSRSIILRHDVDTRNEHSIKFASIQHSLDVRGSYYFRVAPQSYDERAIKQIANMGHEIGYHYETMDTCKGNVDKAYDEFCRNLEKFRKIVPVSTICMHGSPWSPFDNREIWKKYNYKDLGIIGEPYFDIDFNEVAYLTDTGRRWNGSGMSIRDKVNSKYSFNFRSTFDIIESIDTLPDKVMFTFHPQRWTNKPLPWVKELVMQNIKNSIKWFLLKTS